MTARAERVALKGAAALKVVQGRRSRRPVVSPFVAFVLIVLVALFGIVFARTALDQGAFDLAELDRSIVAARSQNTQLRLEVARLESPTRVAPLAEQMGMVFPTERDTVVVERITDPDRPADPRWASIGRYAAASVTPEAGE
ncbi:MAG: cell division protein FtsL [Acidimicrobiia bacterium]|nr:cell division protein FtsL [Acidimicrobiia bacterium]